MFIQNRAKSIAQKLNAKNIAPLNRRIYHFGAKIAESSVKIDDIIALNARFGGDSAKLDSADLEADLTPDSAEMKRDSAPDSAVDSAPDSAKNILNDLEILLKDLKPWRKGPFNFCGIEVQSEWDSAIKFNIIKKHLNIANKAVADIGCNNGYYMFRMLPLRPSKIVGFEPSAFCKMQFDLINAFAKSDICFELLGIEDLAQYDCKFDCIICLGVLYHRTNPIDCLRILKNALNQNGEILLDTLIIEGESELVLSPLSYAKMKNVYFIPSISAFQNWLIRAGFRNIELLEVRKTTHIEQKKTAWSGGESLEDFLDKKDKNKTIEGYGAPTRAYFKAKI